MSKLEQLIDELCTDGVEWTKLSDICEIKNGYTPSKTKSELWKNGTVPWFRLEDIRLNGNLLTDSIQKVAINAIKKDLFKKNSIIISTTATIGVLAIIKVPFICNQQLTVLTPKQKIVLKYLYYYLNSIEKGLLSLGNSSGGLKIISNSSLKQLEIPLPPLQVQEEIVRILDTFTELTAELTAELTMRKQQYEYYRDSLLTFGEEVPIFQLNEVAQYSKDRINAIQVDKTTYIGVDNLLQDRQGKTDSNYVPTEGRLTRYEKNNILIGNIRPYLKKIWFSNTCGGTNGDVLVIQPISDKLLPKYLYVLLCTEKFFNYNMQNAKGAKMPRGNKEAIMRYSFQLPSLEEQQRIVDILDRFDTLCNDISQGLPAEIKMRQQQYEYYRNKLLTFEKAKA